MEELATNNKDSSCHNEYVLFPHLTNICAKQLLWRKPCASEGRKRKEI